MLGEHNVCAVLAVKDMDTAQQFYNGTLGLEPGEQGPGGTFYKSGSGGIFVYPSQYAGTNQATAAAWSVEDVERVAADLKTKGVTFEHYDNLPGVELQGDVHVMGDLKSAWFKDPDGNILNLVNMGA